MTGQADGHIGERIRDARHRSDLTLTALAARLGVWEKTVRRWETGENYPDGRYLRRLSEELDVSLLWLLGDHAPNGDETPAEVAA